MSAVLERTAFPAATLGWPQRLWAARIHCSSELWFAVLVSLSWLVFYNASFWRDTFAAMWHPAPGPVLFLVSLSVLVASVQAILVLLLPARLMRFLTSALFIVAAFSSYFCNEYGAVMNQDMMRNVLETDRAEIGALLTSGLFLHVLWMGLIPALVVWKVRLASRSMWRALGRRLAFVLVALAVSFASLYATADSYAVFFREHKPLRYAVIPVAPVTSLVALLTSQHRHDTGGPLLDPAGKVQRLAAAAVHKPLVIFLVVGETARAANFQLGGYVRPTNPGLSTTTNLVYFSHTASCGTSTAISVPCLFSGKGRASFDVKVAGRYTNLLDSLVTAGFDVEWLDNNSGCKGVCARVKTITYDASYHARECHGSNCYDEVLLADLPARLKSITHDTVVVFHQVGSHGPAYSERYPAGSGPFEPACHSNQLDRCSTQEIVNAYDNTIAYTDSILTRQIAALRDAGDSVDSLLIYASDHGESLGEQGVYLHGLPYRFAPAVQREVPMLLWASQGYQQRAGLNMQCLRTEASGSFSHDNFYHTVLGAADVRNAVYDASLDILASCRGAGTKTQPSQLTANADNNGVRKSGV